MELRELSPEREEEWESFAREHGTIYHSLAWKRLVEESYNHRPIYLMAYEQKELQGIFPLFFINNPYLRKRFLCSVPFADNAGPVLLKEEGSSLFFEHINGYFDELKLNFIELKGVRFPYVKAAEQKGYQEVFENARFEIDLSVPFEQIHEGNRKRKIYNQVRKAEKLGVTVEQIKDPKKAVDAFYPLHLKAQKVHGTPPPSQAILQESCGASRGECPLLVCQGRWKVYRLFIKFH